MEPGKKRKRSKGKQPFDSRGGVIVLSKFMLNSTAYQTMPPTPKALMTILHLEYRYHKSVDLGVREAGEKLGCSKNTASRAFKTLESRGFIKCETESVFNTCTGSQSRSWLLTWLPFDGKKPTNDWEQWGKNGN